MTSPVAHLFAEAGFAMLEVGSINIKNTKNILVREGRIVRAHARTHHDRSPSLMLLCPSP